MQIGLSVLFGLATVATTLNANGVLLLQPDQLDLSPSTVLSALPGTLIFLALLGALLCSRGLLGYIALPCMVCECLHRSLQSLVCAFTGHSQHATFKA